MIANDLIARPIYGRQVRAPAVERPFNAAGGDNVSRRSSVSRARRGPRDVWSTMTPAREA